MSIPKLSINIGIMLILLGILSYILTDFVSITALIPAFFGIVFAGLGFWGKNSESMRKHTMHAALLLALLGLGGSFSGLTALIGALSGTMPERMAATVSQSIMAVLCIIFLIAGIKSFMDARKTRNEDG
jgi:hypothetical protein